MLLKYCKILQKFQTDVQLGHFLTVFYKLNLSCHVYIANNLIKEARYDQEKQMLSGFRC